MKIAAIEKAQEVGKGDNYKDMYPATRADNVSREEFKETFQRYFQDSYDILTSLTKSLERKWNERFAEAVENDMRVFRAECEFARELFGVCVDVDDKGHVTISPDTQNYYAGKYTETKADVVERCVLKRALKSHFQSAYKDIMCMRKMLNRKWEDWLAEEADVAQSKFRAECNFIQKLFGLRVNISDAGNVTIKGACE